ncbi:hypothetical protein A3E73_01480 [Candidatus Beckwithbacteria bacterium RIFCSPHIGHO2_12_FULL_47_17]|uniref:Uncharacterized protein n=1 Tax=Candidatus Beckwithbacteria bacterium RIFCSPHIGHO2_12_FULL_47_17 TaxID=1797460 RepID=A0A1F5DKE0_9BACT|nr:MAG: hypothetical protein A3E73_01480 [Candidatus Beckwithbacteria bacterium RIFCSPHIGHO2_12_FULL_47_17]
MFGDIALVTFSFLFGTTVIGISNAVIGSGIKLGVGFGGDLRIALLAFNQSQKVKAGLDRIFPPGMPCNYLLALIEKFLGN